METSILKEKLHLIVDSADENLLEILHTVASEFEQSNFDLTPEQLLELKKRLELFDSGKMSFSTWDEMISRIESK
ncbi:addiction module protein [uncultured Algoriphagus sp.]|uniref:addiction module protein n=1 Tax=uncultured Algoriphagus sp. TaxID=417365 RepID=UPI0030EDCB30